MPRHLKDEYSSERILQVDRRHAPGLKNMYRTVAVFLCTLNGCPVSTIRFATIRVVSAFRKVPIATNLGSVDLVIPESTP